MSHWFQWCGSHLKSFAENGHVPFHSGIPLLSTPSSNIVSASSSVHWPRVCPKIPFSSARLRKAFCTVSCAFHAESLAYKEYLPLRDPNASKIISCRIPQPNRRAAVDFNRNQTGTSFMQCRSFLVSFQERRELYQYIWDIIVISVCEEASGPVAESFEDLWSRWISEISYP